MMLIMLAKKAKKSLLLAKFNTKYIFLLIIFFFMVLDPKTSVKGPNWWFHDHFYLRIWLFSPKSCFAYIFKKAPGDFDFFP